MCLREREFCVCERESVWVRDRESMCEAENERERECV